MSRCSQVGIVKHFAELRCWPSLRQFPVARLHLPSISLMQQIARRPEAQETVE